MNKRGLTALLILVLCGVFPISCDLFCSDSCGCKPLPAPRSFSIEGFSLDPLIQGSNTFDPNQYYPNDSYFQNLAVSDYKFLTEGDVFQTGQGLVSVSMACDPIPDQSSQKITEIKIIQKLPIVINEGLTIAAGQEMTEYFEWMSYPSSDGQKLGDFLEYRARLSIHESVYFKLIPTPSGELTLTFDLGVRLDDGSVFTWEGVSMRIK